jgi:hypothetical protein
MKMINILLLLCLLFIVRAQDQNLKLGGYLESKMSCSLSEDETTSANALFRMEGNYDVSDKGKVEAHLLYFYDMQPLDPFSGFKEGSVYDRIIDKYYQETIDGIMPVIEGLTDEERDLLFRIMEIYSSGYFDHLSYSSFYPKETLVMDRALIKLYFGSFDLIFGKQQIAWGTGYVFNPTDIWNIKDPTDPNGSKIGVLAANLDFFFGENSSLNIIAAPGSNFDHMKYGFRIKSTAGRYEYSLSAIRDNSDDAALLNIPERLQLGADFSGEIINEIGFFGEAAISNPRYAGMEMNETDSVYIQFCTGFDYTFKSGLYLLGEYYYNGIGKRDYRNYDLKSFTRLTGGEMSGLAQNYISAVVKYPFLNDYSCTLISLVNMDDLSCALIPELEYSFHQNISVRLNSNLYTGSSSRSEFGGLLNKISVCFTGYF